MSLDPPLAHTNEYCGDCFLGDEGQGTEPPAKAPRRVPEEGHPPALGRPRTAQGGAQGEVQGR